MEKMNKIENLINLRNQTELLESVGWDEEILGQLFIYLESEFSGDNFHMKHPTLIIEQVKESFGESCALILEEIFKDQMKAIIQQTNGVINDH